MKKKSKIAFGRLDLLRNDTLNNKSKIRIGFIGGGPNSFIGYTHRLSARFDNKFEFVAGIFSKDKKKSKSFGSSLGLADDRCYSDYKSMASAESKRNDGIQALGIMTPSGDHYKIAKVFIENIPATNSNLLSNLADNLWVYPINELGPPPIKPILILFLLFKVSFLSKSNLPKSNFGFFFH